MKIAFGNDHAGFEGKVEADRIIPGDHSDHNAGGIFGYVFCGT